MSKKFTLVTFRVQDGEREYYNYYSFHTSDYQKMTPMQAIAHFFEGDKKYKLDRFDQDDDSIFWLEDMQRAVCIQSEELMNLTEHGILQKFNILHGLPSIIFPKTKNVIQLEKMRNKIMANK